MFERFTQKARAVITAAKIEAEQSNVQYIGTEHLLIGLLAIGEGKAYDALHAAGLTVDFARADAARLVSGSSAPLGDEDAAALRSIGIDLDAVVESVERSFGPGALSQAGTTRHAGRTPLTRRSKKVLELALREALRLGNDYIGTEHLLLGLFRSGDGVAMQVLANAQVDVTSVRDRIVAGLGDAKPQTKRRLGIFGGSARFTSAARDAMDRATEEAVRIGSAEVGDEHILLAVADSGIGPAYAVLSGAGLTAARIRTAIVAKTAGATLHGKPKLSQDAKKVVSWAQIEVRFSGGSIEPEQLLLGVLSVGSGFGAEILRNAEISIPGLHAALLSELGKAA